MYWKVGIYINSIICDEGRAEYGYLLFSIEDSSHDLVGTDFYPHKTKIGNQELENWLDIFTHVCNM